MANRTIDPAPEVALSLEQFGQNIRTARLRRAITVEMLAQQLGVHRTTITRMEAGSPAVSIGHYSSALFHLGLGTPFADIAAPAHDTTGLEHDLRRLPQRIRTPAIGFPAQRSAISDGGFGGVLKIGVVGAMTGPYALWGLVSRYAAETTAALRNDQGGIMIGGKRHMIEILCEDDGLNPERSYAAVSRLLSKGVRYIIGPNVEQTAQRVMPLVEEHGAMLFPYAMSRSLYRPPSSNAVLSQVAGYQAWPWMFQYLRAEKDVSSVAVLSPDTPEATQQRREAIFAARQSGLDIVSCDSGYRAGTALSSDDISRMLFEEPDLIVLPNLAPGDAAGLIRAARDTGFRGHFATEAAQDARSLYEDLGHEADGMILLGGALSRGTGSNYLGEYVERYMDIAGTWHDEGGTKAYALEFILATLGHLGPEALSDVGVFKAAIPDFAVQDPFLPGEQTMRYTGQRYFSQQRQLRMPLSIKQATEGTFQPLLSGRI